MLHRTLITVVAVNFLIMGTVAAADFGSPKRGGDGIREVVKSATSTPYQARNEPSVDVEEKLNDYIDERGWTSDYTPGNFRIFQISTYSFPLRNPKRDRGFYSRRPPGRNHAGCETDGRHHTERKQNHPAAEDRDRNQVGDGESAERDTPDHADQHAGRTAE